MGCGNNKQRAQDIGIPIQPTVMFVDIEKADANAFFDDVMFLPPSNSPPINNPQEEIDVSRYTEHISMKKEDLENSEEYLHRHDIGKVDEDEEARVVKVARKLEDSIDAKISKYPRKLAPIPNAPVPTTYTQFPLKQQKPKEQAPKKKIVFDIKGDPGFNFDFLDQIQQEKKPSPKNHIDSLIKDLESSSRSYAL
ncbi:unnamed protein product [Blepharisma stoltei]|uniref:Uncharacterized protein n=1 Tax=Blepharisma stoltei TaxID=1481888 RepID=A0AAU9IVZ5_9CILI|nr:unnamed protein product [Blepharisma stoltei]